MSIIGRAEELQVLNYLYDSNKAEFLALYGRRRVGKTFLIREFFQDKKEALFFNATGLKDGSLSDQITNFMERIGEVFYDGTSLEKQKTWRGAFKVLTRALDKRTVDQKVVVFIDEIPWMATPKSKLLQSLDYYWNQYWSNNHQIKLIICGSSASWMLNKIIKNKGGLHNRITEKILLEPFKLHETKAFLEVQGVKLNNQQILSLYMVTGGVPYYLSKIKWKGSAAQIIEKLAFGKKAFLMEEFDGLFASLFTDHENHIKIVRALAESRYGIGKHRLLEMVGSSGGNSANRLQELEDAGFIMGFKSLYSQRKGIYYRLIDEYTGFYLKWIEPIKNLLQEQALDKGNWQAMQLSPEWNSWLGYAFESVCYKHLIQIRRALELSPADIASTWRYAPRSGASERGAQIDLLFDRKDDAVSICEIKYTDESFLISKDYYETLERKLKVFTEQTRTKKQLLLYFVSANGLKKNMYSKFISGVVTLDDLFN